MSKNHVSGYQCKLRQIAKLQETIAEQQVTIDLQSARISELNAESYSAQTQLIKERTEHEKQVRELFEHMGWWRRLLWKFDHHQL